MFNSWKFVLIKTKLTCVRIVSAYSFIVTKTRFTEIELKPKNNYLPLLKKTYFCAKL